jgi:hypothetical protein
MLSPDDRTLLVDLLAPPPGYRLEQAVATTFTLDLSALLTVPLGFAGADLARGADPLTTLQAVREYSERIDVFCQTGNISVPAKANDLLSFLEPIVHPVDRPKPGYLFHPKVWVLRFSPVDGTASDFETADRYRLVCGSRNLTHDCAWDAAITLDGTQANRRFARNNPLCDFIASLPGRAFSLDPERADRIEELAEQLHAVEWEAPDDANENDDWLRFHSFGRVRSKAPDLSGSRMAVISPFVNGEGIQRFNPPNELHVISRGEEFDTLDDAGREWVSDDVTTLYVLNDDAAIPEMDEDDAGRRWALNGLHAKVYVLERGRRTHVLIGSANATEAAWNGNDEFLVELVCRKATHGIDALLGEKAGFRKLLTEYTLGERAVPSPDEELRRTLENTLRDLTAVPITASLTGSDDAGWEELVSTTAALEWHVPHAELTVGLLTLPAESREHSAGAAVDDRWKLHALEDATPFITLQLRAGNVTASTVAMAHLVGDSADRLDRVLARQFKDERTFLRFLLLLLALAGSDGTGLDLALTDGLSDASVPWTMDSAGLLESLLRALARSPRAIDDAAHLVERLSATEEGRSIFPAGWHALWSAVLEARARLGGAA